MATSPAACVARSLRRWSAQGAGRGIALSLFSLLAALAQPDADSKPMDYAVVGQAKSGTSTLWFNLMQNDAIKWVGHQKESFFFNAQDPDTSRCDNRLEVLHNMTMVQRRLHKRNDLILGDWSVTHFSCTCCPVALKMVNPNMKIIIVLRDPMQRALSRFVEQKRQVKFPQHRLVANHTFVSYLTEELGSLQACLARAAPYRRPGGPGGERPAAEGGAAAAVPVGWGAGMDLGQWMEMQCFNRHTIFGWSVYDVYLGNYLAHFPPSQVLVLYTEELAESPLETLRRAEVFLGAPPHAYDTAAVSKIYNSRECYHWKCARARADVRPLAALGAGVLPDDAAFTAAVARLTELYRPSMRRLFQWADEGRIRPVPPAWRATYG